MDSTEQRIVIVDLRIPFFRLVFFLVKMTLAAIPAAIILAVLSALVGMLIAALFGGHMDWMMRRWTL
jgi:hypothetical protein